jgi:hypothetical protein
MRAASSAWRKLSSGRRGGLSHHAALADAVAGRQEGDHERPTAIPPPRRSSARADHRPFSGGAPAAARQQRPQVDTGPGHDQATAACRKAARTTGRGSSTSSRTRRNALSSAQASPDRRCPRAWAPRPAPSFRSAKRPDRSLTRLELAPLAPDPPDRPGGSLARRRSAPAGGSEDAARQRSPDGLGLFEGRRVDDRRWRRGGLPGIRSTGAL